MSNVFQPTPDNLPKEVIAAWEDGVMAFDDDLAISKNVGIYKIPPTTQARTGGVILRPVPPITFVRKGLDQTGNFKNQTEITVPAVIDEVSAIPFSFSAFALNDPQYQAEIMRSSLKTLASEVNKMVIEKVCANGSLFVPIASAAGDVEDVNLCGSLMDEIGVSKMDRHIAFNTRDYGSIAANAVGSARSFGSDITDKAYKDAMLPKIGNFFSHRLDYSQTIAAKAATGITMDTRASAGNYYVPKSTETANNGAILNVDNRYQTITVSSTTGIAPGDAFKIEGVTIVNAISKAVQVTPKTFRVIKVLSSTQLVISMPIISAQGGSVAELQYQNCKVAGSGSATAAITFLNTAAASANVFWQKGSVELMPGTLAVPYGVGNTVQNYTTPQGVQLLFQSFTDINTSETLFKFSMFVSCNVLVPDACGVFVFNQ